MENKKVTYEEDIVLDVISDFENRRKERKPYESRWLLNMNFYMGNQYSSIGLNTELIDHEKQYFWQEREVYNHISPIVELRLSKLARVKPSLTVVPFSDDQSDINSANMCKKILKSATQKLEISKKISLACMWSEICGTVFYKVTWDSNKGRIIGEDCARVKYREGDVDCSVVSPFEIFPDSNAVQNVNDCNSIIHALAMHVNDIKNKWGVDVEGRKLDVFTFDNANVSGGLGYHATSINVGNMQKSNHALVLEKYEKPSIEYPNGRLIIVAGDKLVYMGELPYINREDGERGFPFVKQVSILIPNCFWGMSIIERCIPIQRAYNAVKNRKHEFLNRLTMGIMTVEDGSVDSDDLEEEGLSPGKVLMYRQGANPPQILSSGSVPIDFQYEETSLTNEFLNVSGVSDLLKNTSLQSGNISGVALQLLIEQDEMKMVSSAEEVKHSAKEIAKNVLRLYKQFATVPHQSRIVGDGGKVELFYWKNSDISSVDVVFETDNEINETLAQKRSMIFDIIKAGILNDDNGKLSNSMRHKVLEQLGFGVWENSLDIQSLQVSKAQKEDMQLIETGTMPNVDDIDDDDLHINEHIAFMLSGEFDRAKRKHQEIYDTICKHIANHKKRIQDKEQINSENKKGE